jgi:hypothetical protein
MSLLEAVARQWARRPVRLGVALLAFAAVTVLTALIAHPRMFGYFASYDDEGYMLTALKAFVNHGHLYDDVFSQYGPFYYEAWGGLFSLLGLTVNHDNGRTVTMVAWLLSGLLLGLATMRMTRSLLLGLATQMLVFTALGVLTNEPMHPVGIIALLLAVTVGIACLVSERPSPYALALLGATVAAMVLVKINVGFFAAASLAFACVVSYPVLSGRRWLRPAAELVFVAIPIVLMLSKFGEGWARHYALHVAIAALAVVLALRAREVERRPGEELPWLIGGFLVLAAVSCLAILAAGTSPHGLVDGVLTQPLRQSDAFTIPMQMARRGYALDLIGLGAAVAYLYSQRRGVRAEGPAWLALTSLFSLGVGVTMALSVNGTALPWDANSFASYQQSMLCFAWVALLAAPPGSSPPAAFARLLLPLLAVLQALHAYPVAGSQTLLAAFLLIPVGALCITNGVRGIAAAIGDGSDRLALAGFGSLAAVVLLWFVVNANLREPLRSAPAAYDAGVALDLPGSGTIHLGEEEVALYERVTALLDRNCRSIVMEPGMDSFYLWTEQEPPSYTATGWVTLFDETHQRRVIEDTRGIAGLCLLRNRALASGWGELPGSLVSYLEEGFQPLAKVGDYELLKRPGIYR